MHKLRLLWWFPYSLGRIYQPIKFIFGTCLRLFEAQKSIFKATQPVFGQFVTDFFVF